jgi:membrane protease YdiL (CAAX protease family)
MGDLIPSASVVGGEPARFDACPARDGRAKARRDEKLRRGWTPDYDAREVTLTETRSGTPTPEPSRAPWVRPIVAAVVTTIIVTVLSYAVPEQHAATAVGLAFLLATYWLALRDDDPDSARRFGLSLGGLLDREPIDVARLAKSALTELGVALALGAVVLPPFWIGYRLWWSPAQPFAPPALLPFADEALGQFLVIALPEEAFYRGFLQTSLDEAWTPRFRILGVGLFPGIVVTSAIFALGHVATETHPSRLAVFFPSLLFGWLRARRSGVGACAAFHALCNLFASYLAHGYGLP